MVVFSHYYDFSRWLTFVSTKKHPSNADFHIKKPILADRLIMCCLIFLDYGVHEALVSRQPLSHKKT